MKLISWNINGMRAVLKKGFLNWFAEASPDILGLQEIKATPEQLPEEVVNLDGYYCYWNPARSKKGYSGTALFSKVEPKEVEYGFGIEKFDQEGRIILARYQDFTILNIYWPNGQMNDERLQFKLDFYDAFLDFCNGLVDRGEKLIVFGDLNTAHRPLDLARPKSNEDRSGFLPVEREWIDVFLANGYIDTFRYMHGELKDQYTWWSYRANARANNVGWRIDYFFTSQNLIGWVKDSFILPEIMGSDHCPIGLELAV